MDKLFNVGDTEKPAPEVELSEFEKKLQFIQKEKVEWEDGRIILRNNGLSIINIEHSSNTYIQSSHCHFFASKRNI